MTTYPDRVETGPYFVPGLPHMLLLTLAGWAGFGCDRLFPCLRGRNRGDDHTLRLGRVSAGSLTRTCVRIYGGTPSVRGEINCTIRFENKTVIILLCYLVTGLRVR